MGASHFLALPKGFCLSCSVFNLIESGRSFRGAFFELVYLLFEWNLNFIVQLLEIRLVLSFIHHKSLYNINKNPMKILPSYSAVIWKKGLSHGFTISKISRKTTLKFETKKAIELYLNIAQ